MKMEEAALVAVDCVRVTGDFNGTMQAQDSLATLGITTPQRINGLRNRIVTDSAIGVPHFGHTLDPAFLATLDGGWMLTQLILVVFNNSVAGNKQPAMVRAEKALEKVQK